MTDCQKPTPHRPQRITVFQQNNSAEAKIAGMKRFGEDRFEISVVSIDEALPPVIDDGSDYLPARIDADLVLDFLTHPDLSHDLGAMCTRLGIPVVASGNKSRSGLVVTPPT